MARTIKIPTPVGPVTGRLTTPKEGSGVGVLLAHGAGAGQEHPWMIAMATRLARAGFTTMTFNYAYTAEGRKAPDRLPKLVEVHAAAAEKLARTVGDVVLAGKSMGGRVGGHVVAEGRFGAAGLVYLGYPLVSLGKADARDTSHIANVDIPQLFVSGTRDSMGPNDRVKAVAASVPNGTFVAIESGDHSFVPLKKTGMTLDDSLDAAVGSISAWWDAQTGSGTRD